MSPAAVATIFLSAAQVVTAAVVFIEPAMVPPASGYDHFAAAFGEAVARRHPDARLDRVSVRVADLQALAEDVAHLVPPPKGAFVTAHTGIARAVARRWPDAPLVLVTMADPIDLVLVDGNGRATSNVTGITSYSPFEYKHLELLRAVAPTARKIGVVVDRHWEGEALSRRLIAEAPRGLGLSLTVFPMEGPADLSGLSSATASAMDGWLIPDTPTNREQARGIGAALASTRKPSIGGHESHVAAGGLMAYFPADVDGFRRAAGMVSTILGGVPARNIAFDRPRAFRLVIDTRAARQMGIAIPADLLKRADRVIQ